VDTVDWRYAESTAGIWSRTSSARFLAAGVDFAVAPERLFLLPGGIMRRRSRQRQQTTLPCWYRVEALKCYKLDNPMRVSRAVLQASQKNLEFSSPGGGGNKQETSKKYPAIAANFA
jgi:hypothetical protein